MAKSESKNYDLRTKAIDALKSDAVSLPCTTITIPRSDYYTITSDYYKNPSNFTFHQLFEYSYDPMNKFIPKKVIFNPPATIVFWKDGTKTIVKCMENERYSEYHGFCAALAKKIFKTNSQVVRIVQENIHHVDGEEGYKKLAKKIMKMHSANLSDAQIAKRLDMSESSVRKVIKEETKLCKSK